MVCLVCRDLNVDKTISLGNQKNFSPTALVNHLRQHEGEYQQYLDKKSDTFSPLSKQTSISSFLTSPTSAKDDFKCKYTQWIIEQGMPFEVGSSASFHNMIHSLNKTIAIPDRKELLFIFDSKKNEIVSLYAVFSLVNISVLLLTIGPLWLLIIILPLPFTLFPMLS
jgi:hypothetical protein